MFYWDYTMLYVLPGLLLALWAQSRVSSAFHKYGRVRTLRGYTGEQAARAMLAQSGIYDVRIERAPGRLGDHYDPTSRTLRLSDGVRDSDSVSAVGVAMHEAGHALQHSEQYKPLLLRTAAVPSVNLGSNLAWPIFLVGMIFRWQPLLEAGIILFSLTVLFALVSLPVEFNASRRALSVAQSAGILEPNEIDGARSVLSAAAMTYVASALTAILQLLRLLALSGAGRRRE